MVQTPGSRTLVLSADPACTSAGGDALTFAPAGGVACRQKHLLTFNPCLRFEPRNAQWRSNCCGAVCSIGALQWLMLPCPALLPA
jgi:hypothetical protein